MAHTCFTCDTVTTAVLRADGATAQNFPCSGSTLCQFTGFVKIKVAWVEHSNHPGSANRRLGVSIKVVFNSFGLMGELVPRSPISPADMHLFTASAT